MFKEDHLSFRQRKYMKVKNIIGRALGGIGLVVLSPVYLAIIVAIKKEDGITAPVFFSQKRVGIHKEYFNLYKFRSMRTDTPHDKPTHLLENPDQYITKVGRFLRKSSLDELPQLWNIARGDMAVIGPRPSQFLIFGMEPKEENELGEYLRGNGSLADVMVPCTRKHMLFMGGKNCYSSSTEMLNSESFFKLMTACRKFVDYVIIDTPPAGIIGDAQIFAHCADAVMIVSRQNYMLAEDINEVMDAFRDKEGKVLGVVLNGVRSFSGLVDSPVGHYYGKYSKYGRYGNYGRSKGM